MAKLTHEQRTLRNALIDEEAARRPGHYLDAITEGVRRYKEIVSGRGAPAATPTPRRPGTVSETRRPAGKSAKRAARIEKAVRETMTAAQGPKPPPGTGQAPAQPAQRPAATGAAKAPQDMSGDELTAATGTLAAGRMSPFWRGTAESAPQAPVAETAPAGAGKPLHQMSSEELEAFTGAAFDTYGEALGMGSPIWKGVNDG